MNFVVNSFNYIDVTIGVLIVLLAIKGFLNGFIRELFGFAGLVGGIFTASRLADTAGAYLGRYVPDINISALRLVGFMAILLAVWISVSFIGRLVAGSSRDSYISVPNRFLGFLLSGTKYFVVFSMITAALLKTPLIKDNMNKTIKESMLYPYLEKTGSFFINAAAPIQKAPGETVKKSMKLSDKATAENNASSAVGIQDQ